MGQPVVAAVAQGDCGGPACGGCSGPVHGGCGGPVQVHFARQRHCQAAACPAGARSSRGSWERLRELLLMMGGVGKAFTAQRTQILKKIGFTAHKKNPCFLTEHLAIKLISWIVVSQSKPHIQ